MLTVNFREMDWQEGLTVALLLEKVKKREPFLGLFGGAVTVILNGEVIAPEEYATKLIRDGDEIRLYPALVGG